MPSHSPPLSIDPLSPSSTSYPLLALAPPSPFSMFPSPFLHRLQIPTWPQTPRVLALQPSHWWLSHNPPRLFDDKTPPAYRVARHAPPSLLASSSCLPRNAR